MRRFVCLLFLALVSFGAIGQVNSNPPSLSNGELRIYFVSAVLRKGDDPTVIKLVHSVQRASTREAAIDSFVALIHKDFGDYVVLDTLASPESAIRVPTCAPRVLGTPV